MLLSILLPVAAVFLLQESWADKATTCPCGWTNRGRIVGGKETKKNEYPWMTGLYDNKVRIVMCGASIITRFHVLTAAHCVQGKHHNDLTLLFGLHNTNKINEAVKSAVERYIIHPDYNKRAPTSDDIAVLVSKDLIPVTATIGPVCMPSGRINLERQKITAIGWGQQGFTAPPSPVLRGVELTVIPHDTCKREMHLTVPQSQICTSDQGKSTCHGDSGGPLVWFDRETKRYTLVALTSYGNRCVTPPGAVNTEVAFYKYWIEQVIRETKPVNICMKV